MADDAASHSSSPNKKRKRTSSSATTSPAPSAPEAATTRSPAAAASSSAAPSPAPMATWASRSLPAPPSLAPQGRCAVCTHKRKRCGPECPFATHFPGDDPEMFHKVRRLFGVSSMGKLMEKVGPELHGVLVRTIKWEAEARSRYPVQGALRVIQDLEAELRNTFIELAALQLQIPRGNAAPATRQSNLSAAGTSRGVTHQRTEARDPGMAMPARQIGYNHPLAQQTPARQLAAAPSREQNVVTTQQAAAAPPIPNPYLAAQYTNFPYQLAPAASREQNVMTMQQAAAAPATPNPRLAANAGVVFPRGHGYLSQGAREQNAATQYNQPLANAGFFNFRFPHNYGHAPAVPQMDQGTMTFQTAPGSNSGVGLGATPLGSAPLVFQQQQPPPSPGPTWNAPWDQQGQPSPPPSP